jgi:hypothetical protein
MGLQEGANSTAVESPIALCARRPHRRAFGSVEHPKLDTSQISGPSHDAAENVDFSDDGALGNPADGRIAGHLADGLEVLSEKKSPGTPTGRHRGRLSPGVTAADDDDVVPRVAHQPRLLTSRELSQPSDAGDLVGWDEEVTVLASDSELRGAPKVFLFGGLGGRFVNAHIQHVHTLLVLAIIAAHIGSWAAGLYYHGYSMELGMSRMKDVSCGHEN